MDLLLIADEARLRRAARAATTETQKGRLIAVMNHAGGLLQGNC